MEESFITIQDDRIFLRHNQISPGRKALLCVHGLGESGLCFQEIFEDRRFDDFNILVPDLIGYGRSSKSASGDYSFNTHVSRLASLSEKFEIDELVLVGHSMGGDICTLYCRNDPAGVVKQFVNIEGDITRFDLFISYDAVAAYREDRFNDWFYKEFVDSKVYDDWGGSLRSCRRYHASLWFCRPEAFVTNALELVRRNTSLPGEYQSEIGEIYCSLSIPRVYCYGTKSLPNETLRFLKDNDLQHQTFEGASHWLMIDKKKDFYDFLFGYVSSDIFKL